MLSTDHNNKNFNHLFLETFIFYLIGFNTILMWQFHHIIDKQDSINT